MKLSGRLKVGGLILSLGLVGIGIGYYVAQTKKVEVEKQRVEVIAQKEEVLNKPVKENWNIPIAKRVYANHKVAFYDLHGKFVDLKPVGDNEKESLWEGTLKLWNSEIKLKVLLGIVSAQGKPMIALARYENDWRGSSTQIFDELFRVLNSFVRLEDEVVVRVKFKFEDNASPQVIKDNVAAMKILDELVDNWDKIRKQEQMLKPIFYSERVGIISL